MKKVLFVAALGVAGLMSANVSPLNGETSKEIEKTSKLEEQQEWCGTVKYITSCGLPGYDSWCTSDGEECLMKTQEMFEDYYCGN